MSTFFYFLLDWCFPVLTIWIKLILARCSRSKFVRKLETNYCIMRSSSIRSEPSTSSTFVKRRWNLRLTSWKKT